MLVRLMQSFSSISLELDSFPPGSLPPEEFKLAPGRKGIDKIWPKTTLTLYVAVCVNMHIYWKTVHLMSSFRVDFGSRCRKLITPNAPNALGSVFVFLLSDKFLDHKADPSKSWSSVQM